MIYTVLLSDGTVGKINSNTFGRQPAENFTGEVVSVHLSDENGNSIQVEGRMIEVLEEREL